MIDFFLSLLFTSTSWLFSIYFFLFLHYSFLFSSFDNFILAPLRWWAVKIGYIILGSWKFTELISLFKFNESWWQPKMWSKFTFSIDLSENIFYKWHLKLYSWCQNKQFFCANVYTEHVFHYEHIPENLLPSNSELMFPQSLNVA